MSTRIFCVALVAASTVGACASYEPSSAPLPAKTDFDMVEAQGLAVGADPYVDPAQQEAIFDADFDKADVIALHVFIENKRSTAAVVRASDMSLSLPDGNAISSSSVLKVTNKVGEEGSVIGATIAFGLVGALVASNAEEKARAARIDDYESKSLGTKDLLPGQSADGVVFFIPPKSWPAFEVASLSVRAIDQMNGTNLVVDVPLAGLSFEPGEPEKQ